MPSNGRRQQGGSAGACEGDPLPYRARAMTARRLRVMHYFRDLLDQHRRLNGAILTVTPVDRSRP